jgi:hypothetical protein
MFLNENICVLMVYALWWKGDGSEKGRPDRCGHNN